MKNEHKYKQLEIKNHGRIKKKHSQCERDKYTQFLKSVLTVYIYLPEEGMVRQANVLPQVPPNDLETIKHNDSFNRRTPTE